jgi:ribA/ribD-fused uncharacterized protein
MTDKKYVFFWETRSPFSQWHKSSFVIDGITFPTAEHYMMWAKARLFNDTEAMAKTLSTKHPRDVKKIGREVKNFDKILWDTYCRGIVFAGNLAKFSQSPLLSQALMDTPDDAEFVEASPDDTIWGIGLTADDPRAWNKDTWLGTNWLGEALTQVKQVLKNTETIY